MRHIRSLHVLVGAAVAVASGVPPATGATVERVRTRSAAVTVAQAAASAPQRGGAADAQSDADRAAAAAAAEAGAKLVVATPRFGKDTHPRGGRKWRTPHFVYRAEAKRIGEVLQDFAASQGLPLVVAPGVDGVVQGNFDTTAEGFLNAMANAFGILWYHDGGGLYIYPSSAIQSRLFRLKGFSRGQVEDLLRSLQLGDARYPLRFNSDENTLLVYGPPRHVDLVSAALESLDAGVVERNRRVVRVFPLRFASAADRLYGDTRMTGVANTLRQLYSVGPAASPPGAEAQAADGGVRALANKLRSLPGLNGNRGLDGVLGTPPAPADARSDAGEGKSSFGLGQRALRSPVEEQEAVPVFQADEGTNAVIVNGALDRMGEYADVIASLDQRPTLVEIEAAIIDVSSDSKDLLGINWSVSGAHGSLSVTAPGVTGNSAASGAFGIATLWSNAGRELLSRIDALEGTGKAHVVARPKVLGVANRAAVMQDKRIAAVRVAGNLEANLYQVEAGTLLKVTPQVVGGDAGGRIKLSLYIEDGSFDDVTVDNIPIVKRTQIATEAHVTEGESLLIGGITLDSDSSALNAVPGLSRVPLVGGLFRSRKAQVEHRERLFMITPRVLRDAQQLPIAPDLGAPALPPAPAAPQGAASPEPAASVAPSAEPR